MRESESTSDASLDLGWNAAQRVTFRFVFSYLVLYNFVIFSNVGSPISMPFMWLARKTVPWIGKHILHLTAPAASHPTGSGDTLFDWVLVFSIASIAVIAATVWSLLDRKRKEYRCMDRWLRVYVGYGAAFTMITYGMAKVIMLQFRPPALARLIEPYGDFSPMGVLWTFMGSSRAYTFFGGASELLGGLLVFFRRTQVLGAMVTAVVMLNVAMMNFAYDVPVKLLASHLVLISVFLMAPDLGRLAKVLVLNKPVAARSAPRPKRWLRLSSATVQTLLIGMFLFATIRGANSGDKQYGDGAPKPPMYGLYEVEEFVRNRQTLPPLLTDRSRWKNVIIERPGAIGVRMMDNSMRNYVTETDQAKQTLTITIRKASNVLRYSQPDADHIMLAGKLDGEDLTLMLRRVDVSKLRLLSRGFHWISEYPFNR